MPLQHLSAWGYTMPWLVFCLLIAYSKATTDCAPPPITVPVGNVTLSNQNLRRGVEVAVGSPPQPFAFMPGWRSNNTYLYGTDGHCQDSSWSALACTTYRGGNYDGSASKTQTTPSKDAYPPDHSPFNEMEYVADTLRLNTDTSIANFPMGVVINDLEQQGYYPQMTLGVGSNSSLLHALKASGKIASRTFSFFAGRFGGVASAQIDGAMAFGGYDKAKVTGKKYTLPLTSGTACDTNMVVTITDIELNFPNGTDVSLFEGSRSESITACIAPSLPVFINIPLDPYFTRWLEVSDDRLDISDLDRSHGLNFWNMRYRPGQTPFSGDVTLKFVPGLTVRIPNDLLVVPETDIHLSSGAIVTNSSGPNLLVNSMQNVNALDMAALGTTFLSAAYLMVNQDAGQFSLWAANPTKESDLVAVDPNGQEVEASCTARPSSSASKPSSSSSSSLSTSSSSSGGEAGSPDGSTKQSGSPDSPGSVAGLPTSVVIGVAVGAVAAGAVIGAVVFWLLRRKKKAAASAGVAGADASGSSDGGWARGANGLYEAHGEPWTKPLHEVDGKSLSAEMPASLPAYYPRVSQSPRVRYEMG
ncbi:aspartic peptidase domain-containing protein [Chaetomium sp. MPI-SDFR-AT-0129]|nr:aspartic peptidase domain-containing protein [Chaetomium sp. MPI-SDFR-AT-0129]